jgi:hypothetical protein
MIRKQPGQDESSKVFAALSHMARMAATDGLATQAYAMSHHMGQKAL